MPRPVRGARKVPVNTMMDPRLLAEVDECARQLERPRSEIIREALRLWLDTRLQEEEVDRRLAELAQERLGQDEEWVPHADVKARAGL